MKKMSLLAMSVAVALVGCGSGGDSDSNPSPGGVVITGFDGYFKNAVVFLDNNSNGVWDVSGDTLLGLTDEKGQLNLGETRPNGTLALQTVTPSGIAQANLISLDQDRYAGIYTVDMDFPGQPMEHELVFRAPNSSDVISPITDLVAITMDQNPSLSEEDAILEINKALHGGSENTSFDPYTDFVSGADKDAVLHKTAQILTESKAENPDDFLTGDTAKNIATEAKMVADDIAENTPEYLDDPSYVAPVDGNTQNGLDEISHKTTVNLSKFEEIQRQFDNLNLTYGDMGSRDYFFTVDINDLFEDKDLADEESFIEVAGIKAYDNERLIASNVQAVIMYNDGTLSIGVSPSETIDIAGEVSLSLVSGNSDRTQSTHAVFTFDIEEGAAVEPVYSSNILSALQTEVDGWTLVKGESLGEGYTLDFTALFSDESDNNLELSFASNALSNGLTFDDMGSGIIGIQGIPLRSGSEDSTTYKIDLIATNASGLSETVELTLPTVSVKDVVPVEPTPVFTKAHFEKSDTWGMGSFDYGDAEVGHASLRIVNGAYEFCFASDGPHNNNTLTRDSWATTLGNLDEGTGLVTDADCEVVTINSDGSITFVSDATDSLAIVYQNVTSAGDYQIIMKASDGELFWLDSTDTQFFTFGYSDIAGVYTQYLLTDDRTNQDVLYPLLDEFVFTETEREPHETILKEGTYQASSITESGESWSGSWTIEEVIAGYKQHLRLPEFNEDTQADVVRRYFTYRDFGDIEIGIGDNDKGSNSLDDNGFFFITSDNEEIAKSIHDAWNE